MTAQPPRQLLPQELLQRSQQVASESRHTINLTGQPRYGAHAAPGLIDASITLCDCLGTCKSRASRKPSLYGQALTMHACIKLALSVAMAATRLTARHDARPNARSLRSVCSWPRGCG